MAERIPVLFLLLILLGPAYEAAQQKQLDVPYESTPYPVVDEMLRIAKIKWTDIVYDLGCGDGRLVIGAANKYGARGVGFDIDPRRIKECKDNAVYTGVTKLVRFIEQDLFTVDIREATVMTIFLLPDVNLKLRPKLLRELRPGSRLVSHNFDMGEWKADESSEIITDDISHYVYLWIIPANISGIWSWSMGKPANQCEMTIAQTFQVPTGTLKVDNVAAEIKDFTLKGDHVRFVIERPVGAKLVPMVFEGKASGHSIRGTIKFSAGGRKSSWKWKASRNSATEKPID
jgi:SAM-dependent methyltransferase